MLKGELGHASIHSWEEEWKSRERKICTGFEVEVLNWIEPFIAESDQKVTESSQDVIKG